MCTKPDKQGDGIGRDTTRGDYIYSTGARKQSPGQSGAHGGAGVGVRVLVHNLFTGWGVGVDTPGGVSFRVLY